MCTETPWPELWGAHSTASSLQLLFHIQGHPPPQVMEGGSTQPHCEEGTFRGAGPVLPWLPSGSTTGPASPPWEPGLQDKITQVLGCAVLRGPLWQPDKHLSICGEGAGSGTGVPKLTPKAAVEQLCHVDSPSHLGILQAGGREGGRARALFGICLFSIVFSSILMSK